MVIYESRDAMERYLYDASGRAVAVYDINTNNIKYSYLHGADMIGKIDFTSTPERFYNVKDHLGSTRLVYGSDGIWAETMNYLPYGEDINHDLNGVPAKGKFKFTGKERDTETNYDYFGARYYNNKLGLWNSVDPLADKYPGYSPYNYTLNNPVNNCDPLGTDVEIKRNDENKTITLSANFYLSTNMSKKEIKAFKNALKDWSKAFTGLSGKEAVKGYKVTIDFKIVGGSHIDAANDKIGNWVDVTSIQAGVRNNDQGFSYWDQNDSYSRASDRHEIGHFFGLDEKYRWIRRNEAEDLPGFESDIMGGCKL